MVVYFMNMIIREQCQMQTCLNKITALSTYIIDAHTGNFTLNELLI